ncbi:IS30 family transposase [Nonomuraea thailandensis]|uniref:IS30 family transposase n=1 Tax=Nonomuraea thailandensis TaxID=1188745 RepID=A0A9X2JXW4_9ACTN|nr:IS30 family transposase [Nonomuraea thailandensis]
MTKPFRRPKKLGPAPLADKRDQYLRLMAQGMSNSAACREVGVNRKTGNRWRYGRKIVDRAGNVRVYAPITEQPDDDTISPRFLSEDERIVIADMLRAGASLRAISRELKRSPDTISREVRRNRDERTGKYHPFRAQRRAAVRRARSKEGKVRRDPELKTYIQQRLDQRWSPEQISQDLRTAFPDEPDRHLAHETIYQAIYLSYRGGLERRPEALRTGRQARRRRRRGDERATRFIDPGKLIHQRPNDVEDRQVPGHWEGDLIVGQGTRSAIGTLVDRTTRYVMLLHLPNGKPPSTSATPSSRPAPGNAARTRTRTACSASTSRRARTCPPSPLNNSTPSPLNSTAAHARSSAGRPPLSSSLSSSQQSNDPCCEDRWNPPRRNGLVIATSQGPGVATRSRT